MRRLTLWQLYIAPFIIIASILLKERAGIWYFRTLTFPQIVNNSTALATTNNRILISAHVDKVVDGDTIELSTGKKVRYVGIDTPETKHPRKSIQCFGLDASRKNKELVEGKDVLLEKDISETDRYGRLLRYVYLLNPQNPSELLFVNEYLVEQGFAHLLTYPPDVKYDRLLRDAENKARKNTSGLWSSCPEK